MEDMMVKEPHEQMGEESRKVCRTRRVGTVTCGLMLVLYGILFIVKMIVPKMDYSLVFRLWPVILIFLGIEILVGCSSKSREKTKTVYDFPAVLLIFIVTVFAMVMSGISYYYDYYDRVYSQGGASGGSEAVSGSRDFSLKDVNTFTLNNEYWNVKVLPSNDNDIHVSYNGTSLGNGAAAAGQTQDEAINGSVVAFEQVQDEIIMNIKEKPTFTYAPFVFWDSYRTAGGEVALYLPETDKLTLKLKNDSGDISIHGISCGELEINNEYGNAKLEDIVCADSLSYNSESGSVDLKNVSCDGLALDDNYGSVRLDNIACAGFNLNIDSAALKIANSSCGDFTFSNEYGDVNINNTSFGDFSLKSNSGALTLQGIKAGDVDLITEYGNVKIADSSIGGGRMESDSASFMLDTLAAESLNIKSTYGDISVRNSDIRSETAISSESGNVSVRYKDRAEDLAFDVKSEYGSIKIGLENVMYDYNEGQNKKGVIGGGTRSVSIVTESGGIILE